MPSHYLYQCQNCDYRRKRYRNVKNCPLCHGQLRRVYGAQMTADVTPEQRDALKDLTAPYGGWSEFCRKLADGGFWPEPK